MKQMLGIVLFMFILSGCNWMYSTGNSSNANDFDLSSAGLTVPDFEFTNQLGERFGSPQLDGQYWLATMAFTNCPSVCPTMIPNMKNLQDEMIAKGIEMKFVMFTVDPETDTPDHLKTYSENVGADHSYWHFLTGYEFEEIQELSLEAFKSPVEQVEESNDIMHSTRFFLVNPEGLVIRAYDGLESNQKEIIRDLLEAVKG
ncbi:SCO family protein [Halalkalibacterium halodurans]|jgi:protein SCO1/2|uniref:SCO family protein n=1 Tax=Halalkalibacterium halodurans TaxID=86665 RepID=UPI002E1FA5D8|nr:SCO family protein [Halalkalibacterium halodurans]MED4087003.1 SCO family protein [Halalkalibacterium halodurans]MED4106669.1 SCO family protein [Halalkalibacterium halodurans]MED4110969.1 SCO family protein [Halalkalibacterium halodurans]MED4125647.1 SCO family protein [Halalkalibacterium halodurans]